MIQWGSAGSTIFSLEGRMSYPCCSVFGMGESTDQNTSGAAALIEELVAQYKELSKAQARCAAVMMEFADTRSSCDRQIIAERQAAGGDPRYRAGEFAGTEIGMAVCESRFSVQKTMAMARRLRTEAPDAWDAWQAGDINHDKAQRISRTLRRLVHDTSKQLLNGVVVDVAVCKPANCSAGGSTNSSPASNPTNKTNESTVPFPTGTCPSAPTSTASAS